MLYLLTFADMRAVGPGVLTGWQAAHPLGAVHAHAGPPDRRPPGAARAATQLGRARARGDGDGARGRREGAPGHDVRPLPHHHERAAHGRAPAPASQRLETTLVATELFHHPDLGSSELVVVTRDVPGLFSLIAGTLAAQGDEHHLRPDPHPRRRHRHRHLPGERPHRRGRHRGRALAARPLDALCAACSSGEQTVDGAAGGAAQRPAAPRRGAGAAQDHASTTSSPTRTPWSR